MQLSNYTPPKPTSPPYPIKNERSLKGAFALKMATVKTIPQDINLIGRSTKNNKSAARAARPLEHFFPMPVPSLGQADTSWRLVSLHLFEFSLGHTCIFQGFFSLQNYYT